MWYKKALVLSWNSDKKQSGLWTEVPVPLIEIFHLVIWFHRCMRWMIYMPLRNSIMHQTIIDWKGSSHREFSLSRISHDPVKCGESSTLRNCFEKCPLKGGLLPTRLISFPRKETTFSTKCIVEPLLNLYCGTLDRSVTWMGPNQWMLSPYGTEAEPFHDLCRDLNMWEESKHWIPHYAFNKYIIFTTVYVWSSYRRKYYEKIIINL